NPAAERLYGYRAEEAIGQSLMMLASPELQATYAERYAQWMQRPPGGDDQNVHEAIAVRKDGSRVPVEITTARWQTETGDFVTIVVRDVTVRKQAEEETRRMSSELERRVSERTAELQRTLEE